MTIGRQATGGKIVQLYLQLAFASLCLILAKVMLSRTVSNFVTWLIHSNTVIYWRPLQGRNERLTVQMKLRICGFGKKQVEMDVFLYFFFLFNIVQGLV